MPEGRWCSPDACVYRTASKNLASQMQKCIGIMLQINLDHRNQAIYTPYISLTLPSLHQQPLTQSVYILPVGCSSRIAGNPYEDCWCGAIDRLERDCTQNGETTYPYATPQLFPTPYIAGGLHFRFISVWSSCWCWLRVPLHYNMVATLKVSFLVASGIDTVRRNCSILFCTFARDMIV